MSSKVEILNTAAMAAVVIGTVAHCINSSYSWIPTLCGGLVLFFLRLSVRMGSDDFKTRRIYSILMFSAAVLCVCAYLMMKNKSYWLLPLMISAVVEFYSSFRLK